MTNWLPSEKIPEFLIEQDVIPDTKKDYQRTLKYFFLWVHRNRIQPDRLSRGDIIKYKNYLNKKGFSPFTVNKYLAPVRSFFRWMDANGYHNNITQGIKYERLPAAPQKGVMTIDEWIKFMSVIKTRTKSGMRDYAMFMTFIYTALRSNELRNILVEDYYQSQGYRLMRILAKGHKHKDVTVRIVDTLADILDNYIMNAKLKPHHPLFPSYARSKRYSPLSQSGLRKILVEYLEKAGFDPKDFTIHSLRHTSATFIYKNGGNIYDLQRFLRHSNPNTTMIYLKQLKYKLGLENKGGKIIDDLFKNYSHNLYKPNTIRK